MTGTTRDRLSRRALAVLCAAQFLVVLDVTVVTVALPAVRQELGVSAHALHWAISAYAVTFGGLLPLAGRLSDRFGARRVFLAGVAVFGLFSVACGLAPGGAVLIAARALQGAGAALVSPSALSLLARAHPGGAARARALGVWGAVGAVGASAGVLLGGLVVELLDWRAIFLVNAPVALVSLAAGRRVLPADPRAAGDPVDARAAVCATLGVMALVASLSDAAGRGPSRPGPALLALASAALLVAAVRRERRSPRPLVPAGLARAPGVAAAGAAGFLHGAMMLASALLLTLYMQGVLGMGPIAAGAGLLATRATAVVAAPAGARLATALGAARLMALGMAGMTAGLLLLARAPADGAYARDLLPGLLVLGVAVPVVFLTTNMLALASAPPRWTGAAAGLLTTSQWVGGALGAAVAGALAADGSPAAIRTGLLACAILGVAGTLVATWTALSRPAAPQPSPPAPAAA